MMTAAATLYDHRPSFESTLSRTPTGEYAYVCIRRCVTDT